MLVSYAPKQNKNVVLLSTMHDQPQVDMDSEARKPYAILDYNSSKGAVDSFDQQISQYSCARKTCRWPRRILYFIVDTACFNPSVGFPMANAERKEQTLEKFDRRRLLMLQIGEELVMPLIQSRAANTHISH